MKDIDTLQCHDYHTREPFTGESLMGCDDRGRDDLQIECDERVQKLRDTLRTMPLGEFNCGDLDALLRVMIPVLGRDAREIDVARLEQRLAEIRKNQRTRAADA